MLSPLATPDVAAQSAPAHGERELKFTLSEGRVDLARRWLERICIRDRTFPQAIVWTIYYDTPALSSLGEKINSDYLKRKIRVRWYSDLAGRATGPAFVEAKLRVGNRRSKIRERLPYPAEEVAGWDVQDARLRRFPKLLNQLGVLAHDSWQPLMLIRYRRDRFIEPLSNSRISLDSDIAAAAVNRTFVSVVDATPIGVAVLETKGANEVLPLALHPLLQLGLHKRSFSKFLVVYSHMTRQAI
jgi:VTC domain